jgi:NAD(P)-dependent dehydrogenase (short-subunit alcohol dehydrogenase family)
MRQPKFSAASAPSRGNFAMPDLMAGKVVVVTGGAAGIGRATAVAFARRGASVVIGDIDDTGAERTVASIRDNGGKASCLRVDVTKPADVQHMIASAVDQYGGLDYAFNNAGFVGSNAGIVETSEEDWHRVMAINLTGVWLCMKYEIPEMLKRGKGAIVNNGSVVGVVGAAGTVSNVASKHGVSGLTKSAALQYATQGIRVNAVAPGLVHTPLTDRIRAAQPGAEAAMLSVVPQGRWCEPEEIADVVVFLCSDGASHVTGHIMPIDGGWTAR